MMLVVCFNLLVVKMIRTNKLQELIDELTPILSAYIRSIEKLKSPKIDQPNE